MPDIKTIADNADIIINGYAFTRKNDSIHVLNLSNPINISCLGSS